MKTPDPLPQCEVIPQPNQQVAFHVDGQLRVSWNFGSQYPRPFFYPMRGPSGGDLTRLGHPGAPNHDHHRSIWYAHKDVTGVDFWSDTNDAGAGAMIRQQRWLAYEDGSEAMMAVLLHWHDGHDPQPLMEQQLLASVRPAPNHPEETLLELDSTWTPVAEMLELGKTNFGLLAVRVSRGISAFFGGGELTNDRGEQGEKNLFERASRWIDYSGTNRGVDGPILEGIAYFDHPDNIRHPAHWHVREDGWMGAGITMRDPHLITKQKPLRLRHLLHAHSGPNDQQRAAATFEAFANSRPMRLVSGRERKTPHRHWVIERR